MRHDGSGGHRKACGERLAPTLGEEVDRSGFSHGQTHMENMVVSRKVQRESSDMKRAGQLERIARFQIRYSSFRQSTAHLNGPKHE